MLGPAHHPVLSPQERERIGVHESGHARLWLRVPGADPVNRVTITPRGQTLSVTYQRPAQDRHLQRGVPARPCRQHARRPGVGRGGVRGTLDPHRERPEASELVRQMAIL